MNNRLIQLFKRGWILTGIIIILSGLSACTFKEEYHDGEIFAMDTIMSWSILEKGDSGVNEELKDAISDLEQIISVTDPDSELYKLNRSAGSSVTISPKLADLLKKSLHYGEETEGSLNIALYPVIRAWGFTTDEYKIPDRAELDMLLDLTDQSTVKVEGNNVRIPEGAALDLGAVGKGYVTDVCVDILKEYGISSAMLQLGGNVYAHGTKDDGSVWRVGIQLPFGGANDYAGILSITDAAVVTSGTYQRYFESDGKQYHHIIDGVTGEPVSNELDSVTIITQEGFKADALSTAYFVMGLDKSVEDWRERGDVEVIWITKDKKVYYTEGIKDKFIVMEGLVSEVIYR